MNIGQASNACGVSPKMIHYYESIGLIPVSARRESGYRDYGPANIHRLAFIRRERDLGFSIERIGRLWSDGRRSNAQVKAIALQNVSALKGRAKARSFCRLIGICFGAGAFSGFFGISRELLYQRS